MRPARLVLRYLCCSRWSQLFASGSSIDPCTELHKMHTGGSRVGGATVSGRALSRGHTARSQLAQLPGLAHVHHAPLQAHEAGPRQPPRSEEHTSELQSRFDLVCRLLLEKK